MTEPSEIAAHFRREAVLCRAMGSPFTAELHEAAAASIERPGIARELIGFWPGRSTAIAARLASALHAAVLSGRDEALAACYPTPASPGDATKAWARAEHFIDDQRDWVSAWMRSPPQTNEVRRAAALFPALSLLALEHGLPLELLEPGASAGLNLFLDSFAYRNAVWNRGDGDVVIETDWRGPPPPALGFEIAGRAGCDQNPLDPAIEQDCLRLLSYIWPDQFDRAARLRAALHVARECGVTIERRGAGDWIEQQLARTRDGRLTVVFHSIFYHYPPFSERNRIELTIAAAGERATAAAPLAWLRYEFEPTFGGPAGSTRCLLDVISWPGGVRRTLAEVDSHGRFVNWCGERFPRRARG